MSFNSEKSIVENGHELSMNIPTVFSEAEERINGLEEKSRKKKKNKEEAAAAMPNLEKKGLNLLERKWNCYVCDKKYTTKDILRRHQRSHFEEKTYTCKICAATYDSRDDFNVHKSCHVVNRQREKKLLECDICGARFAQRHGFDLHVDCHLNGETFVRDKCGRASCKNQLDPRRRVTRNPGIFKCDQCQRVYRHLSSLSKHISTMHKTWIPSHCQQCGRTFKYSHSLETHVRQVHMIKQLPQSDAADAYCCYSDDGYSHDIDKPSSSTQPVKIANKLKRVSKVTDTKIARNRENGFVESKSREDDDDSLELENICPSQLKSQDLSNGQHFWQPKEEEAGNPNILLSCHFDDSIASNFDMWSRNRVNRWRFSCVPLHYHSRSVSGVKHVMYTMQQANDLKMGNEKSETCPAFLEPIVTTFDVYLLLLSDKNVVPREGENVLLDIDVIANNRNQVTVQVNSRHENPIIKSELRELFAIVATDTWHLQSMYFSTNQSKRELIYGVGELYNEIKGFVYPLINEAIVFNPWGVELLTRTIEWYLEPTFSDALIEIGSTTGITGLFLSKKCRCVVEFDCLQSIEFGRKVRMLNDISNLDYTHVSGSNIQLVAGAMKTFHSLICVVNLSLYHTAELDTCLQKLRGFDSLRRLVVVTPALVGHCWQSLAHLTRIPSGDGDDDDAFKPVRYCAIETVPASSSLYNYVILMHRSRTTST